MNGRPRGARLLGPWLVLPAGTAGAVALVLAGHLRPGANLLGATLAVAAVLRAVLPVRAAGAIVVRSRAVDVLLLGGAAAAALVLAATLKLTA